MGIIINPKTDEIDREYNRNFLVLKMEPMKQKLYDSLRGNMLVFLTQKKDYKQDEFNEIESKIKILKN